MTSAADLARVMPGRPLDVEAIRARADAATEGEWRARRHGRNFSITTGLPGSMLVVADVYDDTPSMGGTSGQPDADFIAAARSDVPALCEEVARLRAALRELLDATKCDAADCGLHDKKAAVANARAALGDAT